MVDDKLVKENMRRICSLLRFTYIFSIILTAEFIGAIDDNMILQDTGYYIRNIYVFDSVLLIIRTLIICSVDYKTV